MDRSALNQPTFAELEYKNKKRKTRREVFLEQLDSLIPWQRLERRVRPHYPKAGRGRRPYDLSVMLRVHIVQLCHNLSDPVMEDPRFHEGRLCYMRRSRCGASWDCGCRSRYLTRVPSCTSATCWSGTTWGKDCLRKSKTIWQGRGCG